MGLQSYRQACNNMYWSFTAISHHANIVCLLNGALTATVCRKGGDISQIRRAFCSLYKHMMSFRSCLHIKTQMHVQCKSAAHRITTAGARAS